MAKISIPEIIEIVLHPDLFHLNSTILNRILKEASGQLGYPITWDDIGGYKINLKVELRVFATKAEGK